MAFFQMENKVENILDIAARLHHPSATLMFCFFFYILDFLWLIKHFGPTKYFGKVMESLSY